MRSIIPRLGPIAVALVLAACSSPVAAPVAIDEEPGECSAPTAPVTSAGECGSFAATVEDAGLRVTANPSGVHVTNRTTRPVFPFVIGRRFSAHANWGACVEPAQCPPLAPGETRTFPTPQPHAATGYLPEHEALVYWWHRAEHPDGARPDSIRGLLVPLR